MIGGNLKSPSLTQNASDDSNSTNLQSSKKLSYNSGIFVPSMSKLGVFPFYQ